MLLISILIFGIHLHGITCQLYGLLLHNPLRDIDVQNVQKQAHRQYYETSGDNTPTKNEELRAESTDSESLASLINSDSRLLAETVLIRCRRDADCIDDNSPDADNLMYCDRHYGYCDFFRSSGELCRTDSQCDAGLICMFGRCEAPQAPGSSGARCSSASDCNNSLCCARQHGERICKPKLKLGQRCFVPLGGLDYSLNELCPCEDALHCTQQQQHNRKRSFLKSSQQTGQNNVVHRCSLRLEK